MDKKGEKLLMETYDKGQIQTQILFFQNLSYTNYVCCLEWSPKLLTLQMH